MSTLGIVSLALVAGIFLSILLGSVVFLIWSCWKINTHVTKVMSDLAQQVHDHEQLVVTSEANLTNLINKINGNALEAASKSLLGLLPEFKRSFLAFAELSKWMLADRDTISSNGKLKPDEYATAEPGESFVGASPTTRSDIEALEDENQDFDPAQERS